MSVELTWFGHSAVLIRGSQHAVLVDPFITDNPATTIAAGDIACTHVALTHGHEDQSDAECAPPPRRLEPQSPKSRQANQQIPASGHGHQR